MKKSLSRARQVPVVLANLHAARDFGRSSHRMLQGGGAVGRRGKERRRIRGGRG